MATEQTKELNSMCLRCQCLGFDCCGTYNKTWTGCIYRRPKYGKKQTATKPEVFEQTEKSDTAGGITE